MNRIARPLLDQGAAPKEPVVSIRRAAANRRRRRHGASHLTGLPRTQRRLSLRVTRQPSTDPRFVALGVIPWLRPQVVGSQSGPTDGDRLTETTFIQRLNTAGGIAPATGCSAS